MSISYEKAISIISSGLRETFFDHSLPREIIEQQLKKLLEKYNLREHVTVEEFECFVAFFGKDKIRANSIKAMFESSQKYSKYLKSYTFEPQKSWVEIMKICTSLFSEEKEVVGVLGNEIERVRSVFVMIESEMKTIEVLGLKLEDTNRKDFLAFVDFYEIYLWKFDKRNTFYGPLVLYRLSAPESYNYDYVSRGFKSQYERKTSLSIEEEKQEIIKAFGLREGATWSDILKVGTYLAYLKFCSKN